MTDSNNEAPHSNTASSGQGLMPLVKSMSAAEAAALLTQHPASTIAGVLVELNPALTQDILAALPSALASRSGPGPAATMAATTLSEPCPISVSPQKTATLPLRSSLICTPDCGMWFQ